MAPPGGAGRIRRSGEHHHYLPAPARKRLFHRNGIAQSASAGECPLDYQALMDNPAELLVVATNALLGREGVAALDPAGKKGSRPGARAVSAGLVSTTTTFPPAGGGYQRADGKREVFR